MTPRRSIGRASDTRVPLVERARGAWFDDLACYLRAAFAVAVLVASAPAAAPARADAAPPCLARVTVSAAHARVGEQIEHRLRLLRRTDVSATSWLEAPEFRGFRVEMLPGGFEGSRETIGGRHYVVYQERRALFALEPGRLEITPARIECRLHAVGAFGGESVAVVVPGAVVEVAALPDPPPGFGGVVGPLVADLQVEPREIPLGGSVRVVASLVGEGNVWDAAPPFSAANAPGGAELFGEPPRLDLAPGPRLRLRRTFVYDVVPRHAGPLALGPWIVPYFDPASGRYAEARSAAATVLVADAPAPRSATDAPVAPPASGAAAAGTARPTLRRMLALLGVVAVLAAGLALLLRARRKRTATPDAVRDALAAADAAARAGDRAGEARALALALRLGIERRLAARAGASPAAGAAHASAAEELAARAGADRSAADAAQLLLELERSRFAPGAVAPDPGRLREAIARLAHHDTRPDA